MKVPQPVRKVSPSRRLLALVLAVVHLLAGFAILVVSSWFIAACSIAGLGFNYMLPAVVIRALALIRIAGGYFSMLIGHRDLLDRLAILRLRIFASLQNKVAISREESLDVLHHHSEEVAAIWISWVGQNVGAFLSLLTLNVLAVWVLPEVAHLLLVFSLGFFLVYGGLLVSMAEKSAQLVATRKTLQFAILQHTEAAPLWHLYPDYDRQAPSMRPLQQIVDGMQLRIRTATLMLFAVAIAVIALMLSGTSEALTGSALLVIFPVALLSIHDWLAPTLGNQKQLFSYWVAQKALAEAGSRVDGLATCDAVIERIRVSDFRAVATRMTPVDAAFERHTTTVVVGSSGAGKSRFLQALSGLLPFEGRRQVALESDSPAPAAFQEQALLTDSFYVEQFPYVLSDSLAENLRVANRQASDSVLLSTLEQVGLGHLTDLGQWLGEHGLPLSGGEKKRLGLARALLSQSSLLMLDEPFESLDEENIERVVEIINQLSTRKIVVLATHILPASLRYQQCLNLEKRSTRPSDAALWARGAS